MAKERKKWLVPHAAAELFPLMEGAEYEALKQDISERGQLVPIVLHEGRILDGRNRYHVLCDLGIEPITEQYDGDSPTAYVISLNLHRRHLSQSQQAMIGADILPTLEAEAKARQREAGKNHGRGQSQEKVSLNLGEPISGKSAAQAATLVGVSRASVENAKAIKLASPELAEKVRKNEMTVSQARAAVKREQRRSELATKAESAKAATKDEQAWRIINGDCTAELATIADARLIFADPPYNIGIDYGTGKKNDLLPRADYLRWCEDWLAACKHALTSDGSLWVMVPDESADEIGVMLNRLGLHRRAWIKWYETFGVNCANNFNRTSRHIFYCVKDSKQFVFNPDAVSRPSDRQTKYGDKRANPDGKIWDDVWQIPRLTGTCDERIPDFPTQIPLEITRAIVGCASEPGDLVVDPFNGSGSTGHACIELGRRYVGIEKSKDYADASALRLRAVSPL